MPTCVNYINGVRYSIIFTIGIGITCSNRGAFFFLSAGNVLVYTNKSIPLGDYMLIHHDILCDINYNDEYLISLVGCQEGTDRFNSTSQCTRRTCRFVFVRKGKNFHGRESEIRLGRPWKSLRNAKKAAQM